MSGPEERRCTYGHEWVAAREGVGEPFGEVEWTTSIPESCAPVGGDILAVDDAVAESPELINSDPYGEGRLIDIRMGDPASRDELLDAEAHQRVIGCRTGGGRAEPLRR
ncbi:glycine cleavage system protein H [Amycolatopsis cihanbeyliensis]|uniref:glycine cleavage system protein H n=1 Tax=Amycolatopsis cihanbeyliensis TaxID=1128664 RepID=UPI00114DEBA0|nr:glycine cleavage system protein H [Amycolatopsis cihanbeyliensis]